MNLRKFRRVMDVISVVSAIILLCIALLAAMLLYGTQPRAPEPIGLWDILGAAFYAWCALRVGAAMQRVSPQSPVLKIVMRVFSI